jgi:hypothetical protein
MKMFHAQATVFLPEGFYYLQTLKLMNDGLIGLTWQLLAVSLSTKLLPFKCVVANKSSVHWI